MNLILIGFMGAGKSTLAKLLSQQLHLQVIEMDDLVYQKTKTKNMHEVFLQGGELLLRETEIAIAKEYAFQKNLIVSTGGGVVLNKICLDYFKAGGGKVIFLNAQFDTIAKRLQGDVSRPLFNRANFELRLPLYLHYADEVIDTDFQLPEEAACKIKEGYQRGF